MWLLWRGEGLILWKPITHPTTVGGLCLLSSLLTLSLNHAKTSHTTLVLQFFFVQVLFCFLLCQ